MKPNLKTKVAGFVVCFALATGIGNLNAQDSKESLLPPTDINTSNSGSVVPAIVPAHQAILNSSESQMLVPMKKPETNPEQKSEAPAPLTPMMLTPRIETEVQESGATAMQTGAQLGEQQGSPVRPYPIQQSAPIIVQAPQSGSPFNQGASLPPIVQGQPDIIVNEQPLIQRSSQPIINPLSNNPLATPLTARPATTTPLTEAPFTSDEGTTTPNYIQASSPLPLPTFGELSTGSPAVDAGIRELSNLPFADPAPSTSLIPDLTEMAAPRSVVDTAITSQPVPASQAAFPTDNIGQSYVQPSGSFSSPVVGCNSCGTNGCTSCGSNGCYDNNEVDKRFAACGFISRARRYFIMDVLYMTRTTGEVQGINLSPINDFDYGFGARTTIGQRTDAANGREFTYFGTFDIEEGGTVTDPLGRISRRFIADGTFITAANLTAFTTVTSATESLETQFHSFEFNRVRWGWDVVKVIFGGRYIYLEDDYDLRTTTGFGETGSFSVDAKNHMFGPQAGLELFYDVGYRWSLSGFGKFGLMLNAYDADLSASANGFGITSSGTNEADLSYMVDLGITAHYQLSHQSRFRLGYNMLYLGEVTTADEAFPRVLSPFSATSLDAEDDAFFSGVSFGLEFYR